MTTTAWVMAELASYLAAPVNRSIFDRLLTSIRSSPGVRFIPASRELFDAGAELYAARVDKAWSLVDCISFLVMQREGLTEALTTDHHFTQAGFVTLLAGQT